MAWPVQLELRPRTWGGRRPGAGRKPSGQRVGVPHRPRPDHVPRHPAHVTLRAHAALPSLRGDQLFPTLRRCLAQGSRGGVRILHFSVQTNHLHLIVEADARTALSRGPRHPARQGNQSNPGTRLGRSVPCACAPHAARGAKRASLRSAELTAAPRRHRSSRSLLICRLVRRVGEKRSLSGRGTTRRASANVARRGRLAAAGSDSLRRDAGARDRETDFPDA